MSDLDQAYVVQDGQVLGPDETATDQPGVPPDQSLSVFDINKKLNGFSKSASECLCKTHRLALELNHGTVSAAHLILAMTLIPNATNQFELRKVDINKAFQAAMMALTSMERGSPGRGGARSSSEELNNIINLALEFARNRDNQEVSVDDLLTALDRLPAESAAAELIRGNGKNGPTHDLKESLDSFTASIAQQVQELSQMVRFSGVEAAISRDLSELRTDLQLRETALERSIMTELTEIKNFLQASRLSTPEKEANENVMSDTDRNLEPRWLGGIFGNAKA